MSQTELLNSQSELINESVACADYDSEGISSEEASGWEDQATLLFEKFWAEIYVVFNVCELGGVNSHHHVHGCVCSNWGQSPDSRELLECISWGSLKLGLHCSKVSISDLLKDTRKGCLDQRSRVQLDHSMLMQVLNYIIKVATVIVDNGPA